MKGNSRSAALRTGIDETVRVRPVKNVEWTVKS